MTAARRSPARESIADARRAMQRRPGVTLAAAAAFAVASLVLAAAAHAAIRVMAAAAGDAATGRAALAHAVLQSPRLVIRAALTLFAGGSFAALLADGARMCALAAYSGSPSPLLTGLSRTPVLITVRAVELTVSFMLLWGGTVVLIQMPPLSPLAAAVAGTVALAPVLALVMLNFLAARVGIALAARGLRPAPSLMHGYDVALRRLPSLLGLLARIALATSPLWLAAVGLRMAATASAARAGVVLSAAAAACLGAAVLWAYASLVEWVGRDARLAGG